MSQEERVAELTHDFPSSVELNVGMTGNVGWSIKLRSVDGDEMQMVDRIHEIHDELTNRFKRSKDDTLEKLEASIERVKATKRTEAERQAEVDNVLDGAFGKDRARAPEGGLRGGRLQ